MFYCELRWKCKIKFWRYIVHRGLKDCITGTAVNIFPAGSLIKLENLPLSGFFAQENTSILWQMPTCRRYKSSYNDRDAWSESYKTSFFWRDKTIRKPI
jgi:hypothetical protein